LNILVINNDPVTCKRIVNGVMQYVKNVRVCGISYSVKEAIEISKKQKIDIAILDYDMQNGVATKFLEFASENNREQKLSVILLAENSEELDLLDNSFVHNIIKKPVELTQLIYSVRELSNNNAVLNQNVIKNKINKELEKLQYNFSYVGTKYMAEAIYEIYSRKYIYSGGNLNKNVYPVIAEKHNTTVNNIKCNITSATRVMTDRCPREIMENYLFCDENEKPKVKEIMYKVVNRL